MAAKANKQFLIRLGVAVIVVAVLAAGVVFWLYRRNPERNIRNGDQLMAQGDYENASKEYGRAVSKESGNIEYLRKYEEALLKVKPSSQQRASELYTQWIGVLSFYAQIRVGEEAAQRRLLDEVYGNARLINVQYLWTMLADLGKQVIARNPELEALRYYEIVSRDRERGFITLSSSEITQIEQDLRAYRDKHQDDPRAWSAWLFSLISRSIDAERAGRGSEARRLMEVAAADLPQAMTRFPENLEIAVQRVRYRWIEAVRAQAEGEAGREELTAALEHLARLAPRHTDSPYLTIDAVQMLSGLGGNEGALAAIDVLRHHLASSPDSLYHRTVLADLLFERGLIDEAETEARFVLDREELSTSFMAQVRFDMQRRAAVRMFDVHYARYELSRPDEKDGHLQAAKAIRDQLAGMYAVPDDAPEVAVCNGWIALAERRTGDAVASFEKAVGTTGYRPDYRVFIGAARALELLNQLGAAKQRLEQALEAAPRNPLVLARLARAHLALGEHEAAEQHAEAALEMMPGLEEAQAVRMQARQAQDKEVDAAEVSPVLAVLNEVRQHREAGRNDEARAVLEQARATYPNAPQLMLMLIELEANMGRKEQALRLIASFREQFPDSAAEADLIRAQGVLEGKEPIDILRAIIDGTTPDPAERPVRLFVSLQQLADFEDQNVQRLMQSGDRETMELARANAAKYRAEAERMRAAIERNTPNHPAMVELKFRDAVSAQNWREAEQVVQQARTLNLDRANGRLYEGRLHVARQQFEQAAAALIDATRLQPHEPDAWRLLGVAYEGVGNVVDAARAYQSAFERRPNDAQTVRVYVNLLINSGRMAEALAVLRQVRDLLDTEIELRELRWSIEAQIGNVSSVIAERRERYKAEPGDRVNAVRLAMLLGSASPTREDIIDSRTNQPRYTIAGWAGMTIEQRQAATSEMRTRWIEEARAMFDALAARAGNDLEIAAARAAFLRDQGQATQGEQVLRDFMARNAPVTTEMLARLAEFQSSIGRVNQAIATLESALPFQSAEKEADAILARYLFSIGQFERARRHYLELEKAVPSRLTSLRLVECEINLRQFAEARARLEPILREDERTRPNIETILLAAAVERGEASDLLAAGNANEAATRFNEELRLIHRAVDVAPSSPMPYLQRALARQREYERTRRGPALEEALQDLTRATTIQTGFMPAYRARAQIYLSMSPPAIGRAIEALESALAVNPREWELRERQISLLVAMENIGRAIEVTRQTIELNPSAPRWHEILGDLYEHNKQLPEAVRKWEDAYALQPSPVLLAKQCRALLNLPRPDHARVIRVLESRPDELRSMPLLRGYYALAFTHRADGWSRALQEFEQAYAMYRTAITERGVAPALIGEWFALLMQAFTGRPVEEAESFVRRVINREPNSHEYEALADMYYNRGSDRANDLMYQAIEATPREDRDRRATLTFRLGSFHQTAGRYEESTRLFEQVREIWPDHAATLNNLAYSYAKYLNQPARAEPLARRALALVPDNYNILDTMGTVLIALEKFEEAEQLLRRSIELRPDAGNHYHLAEVLRRTNRATEARRLLDRALELNPDPRTRAEIERLRDDIRNQGG